MASETVARGANPRGRILVVEGGAGRQARRFPPRGGRPAPALSVILAAISPQVLLAADAVDTVHLPSATDAAGILSHLRAAVRHPGPLLVHLGGHLVRNRRTGGAELDLGEDRLAWQALVEELRLRPVETTSLVVADLSADEDVLPPLRVVPSPLGAGLPLWAAVNPDPRQVGTFTRALVETLHGGRPGADGELTPEQLHQQVHSVLRPDVLLVASHSAGQQVFRNTARRLEPAPVSASADAVPPADTVPMDAVPAGFLPVLPTGLPPLPEHPPTVHLQAVAPPPGGAVPPPGTVASPPGATVPDDDYQQAIGVIVAAADAGEHTRAATFARELEREALAAHGPDAEPFLRVRQVRAHVSRLAGEQAEAAELYRAVALGLLRTRGADDKETRQATANAEACWRAVEDDAEARRLGPDILLLRRDVPDTRRLRAVEKHLARLEAATTPAR
ncbi:hypothetical protein [Streptacidiphilus cavernicola]|uniref:Uncharacterized protein n=1 Tax=Streptacidiphilus cavernicola TaxID=3342716 RepID=A0ABV6W0N3_9ACTN